MEYKVVVTADAEEDLNQYIRYKEPQSNVLQLEKSQVKENNGFVTAKKVPEHSKTGVIDDDVKGTVTIVAISEKHEAITESNSFEKMKKE